MGVDNFYPAKIKRLVEKYKYAIKLNESLDVKQSDEYELGIFEGQKEVYKDIIVELLSLLVDGVYSDLGQSEYENTRGEDFGK